MKKFLSFLSAKKPHDGQIPDWPEPPRFDGNQPDPLDDNFEAPTHAPSRLKSVYDTQSPLSDGGQNTFQLKEFTKDVGAGIGALLKSLKPQRRPQGDDAAIDDEEYDDFTEVDAPYSDIPDEELLSPEEPDYQEHSFEVPSDLTSNDIPALAPTPTPAPAFSRKLEKAAVAIKTKREPKRSKETFDDEKGWLVAQNLAKSFRRRPVVRDVTLAVKQGEAVGLLGPNGAGKTTVFYMITGLIRPDKGAIRIDGNPVTKLPMYARARLGIGYLPQEASIFRGLSVEDNIKAVLEIVEPNRAQRREDLERLLEDFGITHLRKSPSIALSGGERRRCEIARALASRPDFMLLDEPFAGIDPIAVGDIQQLVQKLTQRGIGVLITDHNVRETLGLIDRAYIIHSGEVLMEGLPEDIVRNEDVRRVYLGEEFTL